MLNVKYIIDFNEKNQLELKTNPNAIGSAWFVEELKSVKNHDEELLKLDEMDFKKTAISQKLNDKKYIKNQENSIVLKSKKANQLIYKVDTKTEQFAVFSEAYYGSGWKVMIQNSNDESIDSKSMNHYRVNYLLRGMEVPVGNYELRFWLSLIHI